MTKMINTNRNSPSIVIWVVFNEAQGQYNTAGLVEMVRALDPSRLINQAFVCGEYGGIGFKIKGHLWQDGLGYVMDDNVKDYTNRYEKFARDLTVFKTNSGLSAPVYTETTGERPAPSSGPFGIQKTSGCGRSSIPAIFRRSRKKSCPYLSITTTIVSCISTA